MASIKTASTLHFTPSVIHHGLLIAVALMIGSVAFSLETLEVLVGIIAALAVWVMKENKSRKQKCLDDHPVKPARICQPTLSGKVSGGEITHRMQGAEAKTQCNFADKEPHCDPEHAELRDCAHAEMNKIRAESDLARWKLKAESEEALVAQLQAIIADLEKNLSQATEAEIDTLLMTIHETRLRAEEVDAELVLSNAKVSELDQEVARASSMLVEVEESAQTSVEARLLDLMEGNLLWNEDYMDTSWPDELCAPLNVCGGDGLNTPIQDLVDGVQK